MQFFEDVGVWKRTAASGSRGRKGDDGLSACRARTVTNRVRLSATTFL
jgi:hypothetical protein